MRQTISLNQQLLFQNVISKYYFPKPEEMSDCFSDFIMTLKTNGFHKNGPFFYSINSDVREDGTIIVECFLPVTDDYKKELPNEFSFNSYFQVLRLASTRAIGNDEASIIKAINFLSKYLKKNKLVEVTPAFYMVTVSENNIYTDIMVGTGY
ncbi:hypothetical protein BKX95_00050 [Streptococcus iniae]|uniref:DUF5085 family protein n=1 Tax=Streptococcus iniae TaxID=1346 RepID=UPI0008D93039|nr:DUF5085 family protein [Streptococcus iniae]OHX28427.1 hypothetical protein BKX95_00050 [Streptococcus iniae]